jgi:hypothetical protein
MRTIAEKATDSQGEQCGAAWADLEFIRRRVPVTAVARGLGLRVRSDSSAHCWRDHQHQHGDRSPSLYFTRKNRWRCAVCDGRTMSNLDLVMAVRGCDLREAVEWITARWQVPMAGRGKHVKRREPRAPRFRVGTTGLPFEEIVLTGFWATMSKAAQSVLVTILAFTDNDTGWAILSFRALRRYSGLSFRGVTTGLRELKRIGLLESERASVANRYRLNFQGATFLELLAAVHQKHSTQVQIEREIQRQRRLEQRRGFTQGKPVSPRESTGQLRALPSRARDCPTTNGAAA